jgi:hypothetical protein
VARICKRSTERRYRFVQEAAAHVKHTQARVAFKDSQGEAGAVWHPEYFDALWVAQLEIGIGHGPATEQEAAHVSGLIHHGG